MPGSLTKELRLPDLDATIEAITPNMEYSTLLDIARKDPRMHRDAPGLVRERFLLVDAGKIVYDLFLSLVKAEGITSPRVRKAMYFVWVYRDERVRRFILERIAGPDGLWSAGRLRDKSNADFFEKWFRPRTCAKVRSNIEFFFKETGLLRGNSIDLDLADGWLPLALQIGSQHEPDIARRKAMTHAPAEFVLVNDMNGLFNATADRLRSAKLSAPLIEEPLEDQSIPIPPSAMGEGTEWKRRAPASSRRKSTIATVDLVARERANRSHFLLERIAARLARRAGYKPRYNNCIDLYWRAGNLTFLAEMKSCHRGNMHAQVRRGISQLLEYRYVFRSILGDDVQMVLILETEPSLELNWLTAYMLSIGIMLAWKEASSEVIRTACPVPAWLKDVLLPA